MSKKAPGSSATHDSSRSSDAWFDLLKEVDAEVVRLHASVPKRRSDAPLAALFDDKPPRRASHKPAGAGLTPPPPPVPFTPPPGMAAAATPAAPKPNPADYVPIGTDLADPKNFGVLPSAADLEMGSLSAVEYRQRLVQKLEFATRILHTSGVPAAVWREWRVWEKTAQERLRAAGG